MANGYSLVNSLARNIGQTVTIFTTSGGESGRGFTGVLASVNCNFVRLITQIGPAPGCALGNCCDPCFGIQGNNSPGGQGRASCQVNNLGSIVDIPIDRIAAFVQNAVGSGW
ncbi:hypothetical protein NBE98_21595 [Clostridium swellfunianum]|uniref:hypothetical protein n=1 Tax=Clostridium swellfunianum TaxID=1367462 RepID=UPI00202EB268|nr:hypothetical protein [Clostridium swellfunianum]MCM0650956.1 hypothetical protein [Clostridium swellfunianum]